MEILTYSATNLALTKDKFPCKSLGKFHVNLKLFHYIFKAYLHGLRIETRIAKLLYLFIFINIHITILSIFLSNTP